jgi:hypothetical protein
VIIEYLFSAMTTVLTFVTGLLPTWSPPKELVEIDTTWNSIIGPIQGLGAWVPFPMMLVLVGIHVSTYAGAFLTKLGLRAFSHVPVAGGAG